MSQPKMGRILTILYIADNLLLALITLGACKVGETLSSVAFELELDGKLFGRIFRPLIDLIFFPIEREHCIKSWRTFLKITKATHG